MTYHPRLVLSRGLTSRLRIAFALLSITAIVLSACAAPAGQAPAASNSSGGNTAAAAPAAGTKQLPADAADTQVLRINTGSTGSASFDFFPMKGGSDNQSWMPLLYVPPMYFDADLKLQPGVFNSWKGNDASTEWTFTIDPRASWSDGTPITAQDVHDTWMVMSLPDSTQGRITQYLGGVTGFADFHSGKSKDIPGLVVVDKSTIQVKLDKPDPIFHWRLATTHMNPIKASQAWDNGTDHRDTFWLPENHPLFSGPYMLDSFNADTQEATMVPNPKWWMDTGPYLSKIEFKFSPDPETTSVMLQNDQVDASLAGIPPTFKDQFPDYFRPIKTFGFNTFWIAVTNKPTDDPQVRKALTLAVDQEALAKAMFPDTQIEMTNQIIDPDLPCKDTTNTWYKYDADAAKAALAASTYKSAENLPILRVTPRGADAALNRGMEAVVESWRQNLNINNVDFQQQPDGFGQDQASINVSRDDVVIRFPDSATYMYVAAHSAGAIAKPTDAGGEMLRGYKNPQVDSLIEKALTLAPDDPQRCDLALQAQKLFMEDNPTILVAKSVATINARDYVANYEKGPDVGLIAPWRIYIKKH
jgi:peptide/nickel transport system substrate-binding protein